MSICWEQATYEHILTYVGSLEHMDIFWHILTPVGMKCWQYRDRVWTLQFLLNKLTTLKTISKQEFSLHRQTCLIDQYESSQVILFQESVKYSLSNCSHRLGGYNIWTYSHMLGVPQTYNTPRLRDWHVSHTLSTHGSVDVTHRLHGEFVKKKYRGNRFIMNR